MKLNKAQCAKDLKIGNGTVHLGSRMGKAKGFQFVAYFPNELGGLHVHR